MIKKFKIILFIVFYIYQTSAISKTADNKDFNPEYLSNYLSAIILKNNQNSKESLKYFDSSKILTNIHEEYYKNYIISLIISGEVQKSINIIKQNKNKNNFRLFETNLMLLINNFKKGEFRQNIQLLNKFKSYRDYDNYNYIIYEVLKSYNDLFLKREINLNNKNFGKLSLINEAFQNCYLDLPKTDSKFLNLINSDDGDYTISIFLY